MRYFVLILLFVSLSAAQTTNWQQFICESPSAQFALNHAQDENVADISSTGASPKKALFLSAIVPGAGQLYDGSYLKALGFLAVESAGWILYITKNSDGNDIEKEFQAYANEHWIESDYWDWIATHSGIEREKMDELREWEHQNFSHGLHREKDQQYYEMVGKYDQFNSGWDDSNIALLDEDWDVSKRSERRLYYEERRDASNRAFKTATTGITIVLFNHILSAVDAAWSVSRHNKKIAQASFRIQPQRFDQEVHTVLSMRLNW